MFSRVALFLVLLLAAAGVAASATRDADSAAKVSAAEAEVGSQSDALTVELTADDEWGVARLRFRPALFPRHERRAILARRLGGEAEDRGVDTRGLHVATVWVLGPDDGVPGPPLTFTVLVS